jgi:DNA-binding NarL/FixJ family response regulator
LHAALEGYEELTIIGEAENGEAAVAAVSHLRPHVVLMDINMPRKNGIEATAEIKANYPQTEIIGLSVNASPENEKLILKAGACMLLSKETGVDELYNAIQSAAKIQKEDLGSDVRK